MVEGWSLLGRSQFGARAGDQNSRNEIGAAWREGGDAHWNALLRLEQRYDRGPGAFADEFGNAGIEGGIGSVGTLGTGVVTVDNVGQIAGLLDCRRLVWIASTHLNFQPREQFTLSGQLPGKIVSYDASDERTRINGALGMMRATYDLDRNWTVGVIGSLMGASSLDQTNAGVGVEVGRTVMMNLQAVAGFNLFGFRDPDFRTESATQQGFTFRLRYKFDEHLVSELLPGVPRR